MNLFIHLFIQHIFLTKQLYAPGTGNTTEDETEKVPTLVEFASPEEDI